MARDLQSTTDGPGGAVGVSCVLSWTSSIFLTPACEAAVFGGFCRCRLALIRLAQTPYLETEASFHSDEKRTN